MNPRTHFDSRKVVCHSNRVDFKKNLNIIHALKIHQFKLWLLRSLANARYWFYPNGIESLRWGPFVML